MAFDDMIVTINPARRELRVAGALNGERAARKEWASGVGQLDTAAHPGDGFLAGDGVLEPACPHLWNRGDQQPRIGVIGRRQHLVRRALFGDPAGIEHDDFVGK